MKENTRSRRGAGARPPPPGDPLRPPRRGQERAPTHPLCPAGFSPQRPVRAACPARTDCRGATGAHQRAPAPCWQHSACSARVPHAAWRTISDSFVIWNAQVRVEVEHSPVVATHAIRPLPSARVFPPPRLKLFSSHTARSPREEAARGPRCVRAALPPPHGARAHGACAQPWPEQTATRCVAAAEGSWRAMGRAEGAAVRPSAHAPMPGSGAAVAAPEWSSHFSGSMRHANTCTRDASAGVTLRDRYR